MTKEDKTRDHLADELVQLRQRIVELESLKTENVKTEGELNQSLEQLQNLIETAPMIICRSDLKAKVTYVNRKFEEVTQYSRHEVLGKHWTQLGVISREMIEQLSKRVADKLRGKPPSLLEVKVRRKDGEWIWVSGIGEVVKERGKPVGFQVAAHDITENKQAEEKRKQSYDKLQRALDGIVKALIMIAEMRDPYTAGHQRRVARLACAIAQEIGFSEDRITGLRLAALIHDIGKIRVPAEILTHPDGLSESELNIVKLHPQIGHDVLNNIEFPWPIAQTVLQHHERMNGSGYPHGQSGEQIILEARILGVADVVEAMASHRPYRPSLGIVQSLDEISKNKGILYDPPIVDACLNLFAKKGFSFEER